MPKPARVRMSVCSAFGQIPDHDWMSVAMVSLGLGRTKEGMSNSRQIASHSAKNASTDTIGVSLLTVARRIRRTRGRGTRSLRARLPWMDLSLARGRQVTVRVDLARARRVDLEHRRDLLERLVEPRHVDRAEAVLQH